MYPEVEQYLAAIEAADQQYKAGYAELTTPLTHDYSGAPCPACEARKSIDAAISGAYQVAWDSLKESPTPLVRWIAQNCDEYKFQAQAVLEMLPAPMSELDALARERRWCDKWDRFKRMAERAGVLSDTVLLSDTEVSA